MEMEELERMLFNIDIESNKISTHQIQEVLITAKRNLKCTEEYVNHWNSITEKLFQHLKTGLTKMDDQLLCATCFFSTVIMTNKQEYYLRQLVQLIQEELTLRSQNFKEGLNTLQVVSMIYGMFQSSYLLTNQKDTSLIKDLLRSSFQLLVLMGNEYSQYTYTVYKTMTAFKKIVGTEHENVLFNKENQIILLNLVNHNWENPITGIRDLNRGIFKTLIANCDSMMICDITAEINSFYWNKAKYLMLNVVIENSHQDICKFLIENKWDEGLIANLHKPGLVSAVTDMYFSVLGKIQSPDQWCNIFLHHILRILKDASSRAIENFNNYWVLTTLKKFPQLLDVLIGELEKFDETEQRLYSILFLVKQGSKIGITSNIFNDNSAMGQKMLLHGIENHNTLIRTLAFDILCISQNKTLPSQANFALIFEYLQDNINSDCTVLRISMLKSLDNFIGELHISFRNMKDKQNAGMNDLVGFCNNIQKLIVCSLNLNGNYQRKITTIKVTNTIIGGLSEIPRKRRQQTRDSNESLIDFLKESNNWILLEESFVMKLVSLLKDPSEDIRDSVTKLLLLHYHFELSTGKFENYYFSIIVKEAMQSMKSKFFYDVSCGQSMILLIVNLLLTENCNDPTFKCVQDVFDFGYNELITEYTLKRDIPKTIEEGKQLHSFISILQVVLEACLNSGKLVIKNEVIFNLLDILQNIANQFSWEQSHSTLSDFSEMSEMVENIIEKSGHRSGERDETKISGLHQMVLNCLWLNVKGSCQLASVIVHYNINDVEKCSKCLMIITHVLETSRHKGAIEGAGVALGKAIQLLTSLPEESPTSNLPQTLLMAKLHMLISEASKMASITRRGAGLSIMVHRIVSSDMRKGKPLFHYFMKTILDTCSNTDDIPNNQDEATIENQVDLPKAILIHFLTKIVTDSSLASDMMFYSVELAELAFSNLISPQWQIRNAALQLYGALVQKLVGQKKASGTDDEIIATVACDELRTHSPKLWSYIKRQLRSDNENHTLETHSNLIPILNLLANCAKRYNFSSDLILQKTSDEELLKSLVAILDSPIHTVRRLTAKCIFNIFPYEMIHNVVLNMKFQSENLLHGALLLFKLAYQYYHSHSTYKNDVEYLEALLSTMLKTRKHSYWSKEVFESTACLKNNSKTVEDILSEGEGYHNALGKAIWLKTCIRNCIKNSSWENIQQNLNTFLNQSDYECYCGFLLEKLENDITIPREVLIKIVDTLLSFKYKYNSSVIWKILYQISLKVDLYRVNDLIQTMNRDVAYKVRYSVPFVARVLLSSVGEDQHMILQTIIFKMSDFERADFDMRYIAALANNEVAHNFDKLKDEVKLISIKTAILLLQDEDEDVRNVSVNYYKNLKKLTVAVHPTICLNRILDSEFLQEIFQDSQIIRILCKDVLNFIATNLHSVDENNPFANESKNIYLEVGLLKRSMENLIKKHS